MFILISFQCLPLIYERENVTPMQPCIMHIVTCSDLGLGQCIQCAHHKVHQKCTLQPFDFWQCWCEVKFLASANSHLFQQHLEKLVLLDCFVSSIWIPYECWSMFLLDYIIVFLAKIFWNCTFECWMILFLFLFRGRWSNVNGP